MRGYLRARDRRKPENKKGGCRTWQLVVDAGRNEQGKRQQVFRSFSGTKAQAETALRELLTEVERDQLVSDKGQTVETWIAQYLAHRDCTPGTNSSSLRSYRELLEQHVVPALGKRRLKDLTTAQVQRFIDEQLKSGRISGAGKGRALSPSTVRRIRQAFSAAMKHAKLMGLVRENVVEPIVIRGSSPKALKVLEPEETRALLAAAEPTRLHLFLIVAAATGMRRGEILGLTWDAIDFENGVLHVRLQVKRDRELDSPKRDRERSVIAAPFVLAALRRHKRAQSEFRLAAGSAYDERGFVFADEFGTPWNPDSINSLFRSICKRAGITGLRLHDLRHSAASMLIAAGVPIPVVSKILGHADSHTTMKIYAHALKSGEVAAAEMMNELIGRPASRKGGD